MSFVHENNSPRESSKKFTISGMSTFIRFRKSHPNDFISEKFCSRSYFLYTNYQISAEAVENFKVRPDDVWVVSFPKCGTTWTQEMVWQIYNNLDYETGKTIPLHQRYTYFDQGTYAATKVNFDTIDAMPSPRLIKSHLPAPLLPNDTWTVKPKIIYVARNVKDVIISFFHQYCSYNEIRVSLDEFLDLFLTDSVPFTPYDSHIVDFWNMRNEDNILFLTYEDMKKDHKDVIKRTSEFLGKSYSDEEISVLAEHLTFDKMSKNEAANRLDEIKGFHKTLNQQTDENYRFIRKGQVGSYREEMTQEMVEKCDAWIKERVESSKVDPQILDIFIPFK